MFQALGKFIARRSWWCIGLWCGGAVLVGLLAPDDAVLRASEPASMLPPEAPLNKSFELFRSAFPGQAARSTVVVVLHRASGLTPADQAFIEALAQKLVVAGAADAETWTVWSPHLSPGLRYRLTSADGQAAMVVVGLDVNYLTHRAGAAVDRIAALSGAGRPAGLTVEITGSAGIGREHNARATVARKRTTKVTVVAVLVILALVYRSPLSALVPLLTIGLSVYTAFGILDLLAWAGWSISEAERTFTVVLLFGAGTDYALFWIARYREELCRGVDRGEALTAALIRVGPAILASAGTTIAGLTMLVLADLVVIANSGRVLGLVLSVSLLASLTLTPATAYLMGRAFFWPGQPAGTFSIGQRHLWPHVANAVVRRPGAVLVAGLALMLIPSVSSWTIPLRYDSFGSVPKDCSAARGLALAREHFSEEALFSTHFLIHSSAFASDPVRAAKASDELAAGISACPGVTDVWHLGEPLGRRRQSALTQLLTSSLGGEEVISHYFSRDHDVLLLEVMQAHPPWGRQAVQVIDEVRQAIRLWGDKNFGPQGYTLNAVGETPYIQDVQAIADADLGRVVVWVVAVIWVIVLVLVRRIGLAMFMLTATLITYGAALGLTGWLFVDLLGRPGVDYKLRILLFVVIVAVGQDYNIFLVTRLFEERQAFAPRETATRAIIVTGPIISSCGLIMAATLGSLSATSLDLTQQLGFALAAGILLDTFLVRPLLIPAFYLIVERARGGENARIMSHSGDSC